MGAAVEESLGLGEAKVILITSAASQVAPGNPAGSLRKFTPSGQVLAEHMSMDAAAIVHAHFPLPEKKAGSVGAEVVDPLGGRSGHEGADAADLDDIEAFQPLGRLLQLFGKTLPSGLERGQVHGFD